MPLTLAQFIDRHGITAEVKPADSNPNMTASAHMTRHFLVTLRRDGRSMAVPFSGGHMAFANRPNGQPSAADVLECLASDAWSAGQPFGDWAADYGYDEDSRSAYATWQTVEAQTTELREFLGESAFMALLDVEAQ